MIVIKDSILFFTEIYRNQYDSLFDSVYLSKIRAIHERYGVSVAFETCFETPEFRGFDLTMMSDKYKEEWQKNSDWLYISGDAGVKEEVERFAGKGIFVTNADGEPFDQRSFYIFSKNYDPDHMTKIENCLK